MLTSYQRKCPKCGSWYCGVVCRFFTEPVLHQEKILPSGEPVRSDAPIGEG
jgi:hypothetical protein